MGENNIKVRRYSKAMFKDYPDVMNIDQLCEILGISAKTGYKLLQNREINSIKVGRAYRIPKSSILNFLGVR